jgi:sugar phosphate isomerase/epimerase
MIALSTGSLYSYGLARVFELAAEAAFDGIEVLVDHRWDTRQPAYLQGLSAAYELPIVALHSPFASQVAGWHDDQLGRVRRTVRLAQEVGAPVVVAHLPYRIHTVTWHLDAYGPRRFQLPLPIPRREPFYDFLKAGGAAMEEETGLVLAIENMPAKRFLGLTINPRWFNSPAEMERFPHVTLDTTHLGTWGLDPVEIYERLRERVSHVHLSNYDGREHRSPPDGRLPLADLLQRLGCDGYRGAVTIECHPEALDAEDEVVCLAALRRALAFCRTHYNGR